MLPKSRSLYPALAAVDTTPFPSVSKLLAENSKLDLPCDIAVDDRSVPSPAERAGTEEP